MNFEDIRENIIAKTDEDIVEMLVNADFYTPEAVEVARSEAEKRGISQDENETYTKKAENKRVAIEASLNAKETFLIIITPIAMPFLSILVQLRVIQPLTWWPRRELFFKEGAYKKSKQATRCYLLGWFLFIVAFITWAANLANT